MPGCRVDLRAAANCDLATTEMYDGMLAFVNHTCRPFSSDSPAAALVGMKVGVFVETGWGELRIQRQGDICRSQR